MERPDFVHLHLHSEYSLSDGIIRIPELVSRASSLKYSAIGLTDLTNLFGLLEFYRSSREKGIKPIVGAEVSVIKDKDSFDEVLEFRVKTLHYEGNDSWVEPTIFEIKETIEKDIKPDESEDCDTCSYVGTRIELEN